MAGHNSQRDGQAVPSVDCYGHESEIHDLFFVEVLAHFFVDRIRDVGFGNQCDSFGPSQRCTFPIRQDAFRSQTLLSALPGHISEHQF